MQHGQGEIALAGFFRRSACVVNGRLRHTGQGAVRRSAAVCRIPCRILCVVNVERRRLAAYVLVAPRLLTRVLLITFRERPVGWRVMRVWASLPRRCQPGDARRRP